MKGLINYHTLDVIYSLPTFDGKSDFSCPTSLTWNLKMNKHFIAGLIRAKLFSPWQKLRPLTQEIKSSVQLISSLLFLGVLGEAEASDYLDALVHLAVNTSTGACLPEIIKRLAPVEASATITFSRATLLNNGLVAALFLKRHSHVEALLQLGAAQAQAHSQTHSFGEPFYVAALYADPRTFCDLIDATTATRQQTTCRRQLLESRLFVALERAASAGRALIFNNDLHESLGRICHHYPRRVYYESALKGAMLASCADVGEALLSLLRIEGDGRLLSDNNMKSFWIEILRLSCSGNSRDIAQQVLDETGIQGWSGSLDLPLEDASRLGNLELVTLLMSYHSDHNLRSVSGAIFWAARCAHYEILEILVESSSKDNVLTMADALCGASISGSQAMSRVLELVPAWRWANARSCTDCTFAQVIDMIVESKFCVSSASMHETTPNSAGKTSLTIEEGEPDTPYPDSAIFDNLMSPEEITLRGACARGDFFSIQQTLNEHASQYVGSGRAFGSCFTEAIRCSHPGVLLYLCEKLPGCQFFSSDAVVEARSTTILQVILDHGWDMNHIFDRLKPPVLGWFVRSEQLTRWLLDHGADPNARGDWDITPLSAALRNASTTTAFYMMHCGGDIRRGQTLHFAIERDSPDQLAVMDVILAAGASINARLFEDDPASWMENHAFGMGTPLHRAVELDKVAVVAYLLEHGANPHALDTVGRTALDLATTKGNGAIATCLRLRMQASSRADDSCSVSGRSMADDIS